METLLPSALATLAVQAAGAQKAAGASADDLAATPNVGVFLPIKPEMLD